MILGERVFHNREISYQFIVFDTDYQNRKVLEREIKQAIIPYGLNKLYDTHDNGYYWLGKCKSVEVEDDAEFNRLTVNIVFDCYPFMYSHHSYFDDVWDTFNFDNGIAGFTKYVVNGSKDIVLINTSVNAIGPTVTTSANMTITLDGESYSFAKGTTESLSLGLSSGINYLTVKGTGTIQFHWSSEVMG